MLTSVEALQKYLTQVRVRVCVCVCLCVVGGRARWEFCDCDPWLSLRAGRVSVNIVRCDPRARVTISFAFVVHS